MMTPPKINIQIEKASSSLLDGYTLLEYIPIKRVKALIQSDFLRTDWIPNRNGILKEYENEKEQLSKYLKLYENQTQSFRVKYIKPRHKYGRVLVNDALGSTAFDKKVKNTLLDGLYRDFDLKNAQPEIIVNICQANDIDCPEVIDYCNNREQILESISATMGVDTNIAKKLMLRLCFFGTFRGFCEENNIQPDCEPPFISKFVRRLHKIAEETKNKNPELYNFARKLKTTKNENNFLGSFYAYFLQEYEFRIVDKVMHYLITQTTIMNHPTVQTPQKIGIYEYDGIKLLKENVDKFGYDNIIKLLNEKTLELTGFKLRWEEKPIVKKFDISKIIESISDSHKPDFELFKLCDDILSKFDNKGIVETIKEVFPDRFVYSNNVWYCWTGGRWEQGDRGLRMVIMYEISKYWFNLLIPFENIHTEEGQNLDRIKAIKAGITKFAHENLHDATQIDKTVKVAKALLCNDYLEFDTNPDLFGCNNGVLDFKEKCFRPPRFSDYCTWSCGYDFTPVVKGVVYVSEGVEGVSVVPESVADCTKEIDTVMSQIFPDADVRKLVYFILSTGLSGVVVEKFFVFNGAGRNGKGVVNDFMKSVLGRYFAYVNPLIYTENPKKKTSSQANPELAKLDRIRYSVSKEPPENQLLQNSVIKDITGGNEIQARQNYSNSTVVKHGLTSTMEANVRLKFAENPTDADAERIVDILFGSHFTADSSLHNAEQHIYPLNTALKTDAWRHANRNAMLNILFLYQIQFRDEGSIIDNYIPMCVRQRTMEYLQESFDIHNIFTDYFEPRDEEKKDLYLDINGLPSDADWTIAKIAQKIRTTQEFRSLPKMKQKEFTPDNVKEFFRKNAIYKKSYYFDSHNKTDHLKDWRLKTSE